MKHDRDVSAQASSIASTRIGTEKRCYALDRAIAAMVTTTMMMVAVSLRENEE